MTDNVYSILTGYLRHQRDIGIDDIVFGRGSEVRKILAGGDGTAAAGRGAGGGRVGSQPPVSGAAFRGDGGYGARPSAASAGADAADGSLFSKLSRLRPADAVNTRKPVRKTALPVNANSARRERLAEFYREVAGCGKCALSTSRAKVIFGSGSADGKLLIVGDAPSSRDEAAGLPFQGEAGGLLGKMIDKMGLDLKRDVFATFLQKCRCADGRQGDNHGSDDGSDGLVRKYADVCRSILDRQIDIIEPKALLIFGQSAANLLFGNDGDIEKLRGAGHHTYKERPVIVTYDLSLLLTETQYRHGAWDDMKKIMGLVK